MRPEGHTELSHWLIVSNDPQWLEGSGERAVSEPAEGAAGAKGYCEMWAVLTACSNMVTSAFWMSAGVLAV
jgi:hypothetical protein